MFTKLRIERIQKAQYRASQLRDAVKPTIAHLRSQQQECRKNAGELSTQLNSPLPCRKPVKIIVANQLKQMDSIKALAYYRDQDAALEAAINKLHTTVYNRRCKRLRDLDAKLRKLTAKPQGAISSSAQRPAEAVRTSVVVA